MRLEEMAWWGWALELTLHLQLRLQSRGLTEVELRAMLDAAVEADPDPITGRWRVHGLHRGRPWRVIVEPDSIDQVLVVVTAFPTGPS